MKRFRIINYPDTLEASHALIDALVGELNGYGCFPLATDKDFSHILGSSQKITEDCAGANGGVGFINFGDHDTPLADSENE